MSHLLNSLLTPQQRAQADAADAAMLTLNALRAERAVLNSAGQAINAAFRPCFDPDYGSYTGHPADPRSEDDDEAAEMLSQIEEAESSLSMARQALEGHSKMAARSLMNEAIGWLVVPR